MYSWLRWSKVLEFLDEVVNGEGCVIPEGEFPFFAEQGTCQDFLFRQVISEFRNAGLQVAPIIGLDGRFKRDLQALAFTDIDLCEFPCDAPDCVVCLALGTATNSAFVKAATASAMPSLPRLSHSWPRSRLTYR